MKRSGALVSALALCSFFGPPAIAASDADVPAALRSAVKTLAAERHGIITFHRHFTSDRRAPGNNQRSVTESARVRRNDRHPQSRRQKQPSRLILDIRGQHDTHRADKGIGKRVAPLDCNAVPKPRAFEIATGENHVQPQLTRDVAHFVSAGTPKR